MKKQTSLLLAALLLASNAAFADYLVTGPVSGPVCTGLAIKSCASKTIHAVKGDDGRLYSLADSFPAVDEYSASKSRCWIKVKSQGVGLAAAAANAFTPDFYEKTSSGEFSKLDVDYLTFKCQKR